MLISVLVALLLGCAKVGPPTGGPVDKEPPRILSHHPERDALEVARDTEVEIAFSEPMNREQTEAAIFTSPAGPLQLSWRGPRLRIAMPLAEERTYVLTVGTGARDLRGNALANSFTLAFATGSQLDQGLVRGWVYQEHQPVAGAHVWAYDLGTFSGEVGLDEPSYQTQSGANGGYEFARLAPGHYRVLAFRDKKSQRPARRRRVAGLASVSCGSGGGRGAGWRFGPRAPTEDVRARTQAGPGHTH